MDTKHTDATNMSTEHTSNAVFLVWEHYDGSIGNERYLYGVYYTRERAEEIAKRRCSSGHWGIKSYVMEEWVQP
jgi:hypothetical protein